MGHYNKEPLPYGHHYDNSDDGIDVVNELATLTANHTHNNTGNPLNASAISNTGTKSTGLKQEYSPVIG